MVLQIFWVHSVAIKGVFPFEMEVCNSFSLQTLSLLALTMEPVVERTLSHFRPLVEARTRARPHLHSISAFFS